MEEISIRPYSAKDRQAVRQIAFDTAFLGEPGSAFIDDQELLEDSLTSYFIDYEPESCFVAASGTEVIGYIYGAKDASVQRRGLVRKLLFKALKRNALFCGKNAAFLFACLKSLLRGEFKAPDFSREYPAVLHINLKEGFRSQGIGARLIATYLDYLKESRVKGVHLATLSDRAARFYEKNNFTLLYRNKRSYFRKLLGKEIDCYIFGKKL
jgi:GNAT superfamily N-acetyltransferase